MSQHTSEIIGWNDGCIVEYSNHQPVMINGWLLDEQPNQPPSSDYTCDSHRGCQVLLHWRLGHGLLAEGSFWEEVDLSIYGCFHRDFVLHVYSIFLESEQCCWTVDVQKCLCLLKHTKDSIVQRHYFILVGFRDRTTYVVTANDRLYTFVHLYSILVLNDTHVCAEWYSWRILTYVIFLCIYIYSYIYNSTYTHIHTYIYTPISISLLNSSYTIDHAWSQPGRWVLLGCYPQLLANQPSLSWKKSRAIYDSYN